MLIEINVKNVSYISPTVFCLFFVCFNINVKKINVLIYLYFIHIFLSCMSDNHFGFVCYWQFFSIVNFIYSIDIHCIPLALLLGID